MTDLAARHVVISGGGTGVGAAIAETFAQAGAKVTILGRRQAPLSAVAEKTGALPCVCDVTDRAKLDGALGAARIQNGPVDFAIANAGAALSSPFLAMTERDLSAMMDVNLKGVVNLWQATLPDMKKTGHGRLIAIASIAGLKGFGYVSAYCAAKHAVIGLVRALAQELARTNVTVNAICPGYTETPLLEESIDNIVEKTGKARAEVESMLKSGNPQNRFIEADEVASAALWLCGEGARSVNGHALSVSGGET